MNIDKEKSESPIDSIGFDSDKLNWSIYEDPSSGNAPCDWTFRIRFVSVRQ